MSVRLLGNKPLWMAVLLFVQMPLVFATDYIHPSNWFVDGEVGFLIPNLSSSSASVANGSTTQNPYDLNPISKPGTAPTLGLQGGYRWTRVNPWFPTFALGLRYQYLTSFNVKGTVEQYSDPSKTNYNYNLNVSSHVLSLLGKLNIYQFKHFSPYVSLGLGEAFSMVGGYSETALGSVTPRNNPGYQNKTAMNMTYSLGLGTDYKFNRNWSMSVSYELANYGKLTTGSGAGTWSNSSVSLGTLSSSAVLLGVRYQIPD